jgi:nicotinate dehydrogenase subunit B
LAISQLARENAKNSLSAGEASQGPVAATIANAFANVTGRRLRDLLFTPERVLAALG